MNLRSVNKLFKIVSPIFFWASITIVSALSLFIISINYKIIIINSAMAADSTYVPISRKVVEKNPEAREYISCDCEKQFNKAYPVVWSGRVMATFSSGEDIGVERYDKTAKYKQFYVDAQGKYSDAPGGDVRVAGRLVGITCAYANTIFGECVGEVVADKITPLNKN
ncbi:MAG: hypothetical protein Q8N57_01100 [bacterium]|nr:hypothetical protein [bacterium]